MINYLEMNKICGKEVYKDQAHLEQSAADYRALVDAWNEEYPEDKF